MPADCGSIPKRPRTCPIRPCSPGSPIVAAAQGAAGVVGVTDDRFRYLRVGRPGAGRARHTGHACHAGVARKDGGVVVRFDTGNFISIATTTVLAVASAAQSKASKDVLRGLVIGVGRIRSVIAEAGLRSRFLRLRRGHCSIGVFARHFSLDLQCAAFRVRAFSSVPSLVIQISTRKAQTSRVINDGPGETATNFQRTRCVISTRRSPNPNWRAPKPCR